MNWAEIQENWSGMSPLLKSVWPKLDDEDLEQINGGRAALAAILRLRYGWGPAEAEQEIGKFEKDVRFPGAVK
jgi:hypothetical protein